MAYGGFATYYPMIRLPKDRKEVGAYVYPCTTIGTIGLVLGLIVCSHVVESKTIKKKYTPCNSLNPTMVWLQQGKTVNDQSVDSYAVIFTKGENPIITSKRSTSGRKRCDGLGLNATYLELETIACTRWSQYADSSYSSLDSAGCTSAECTSYP